MSETELKNWEDLNYDERAKVLEAYQNTEDRNESDKVAPREEDVKDYYEENAEKFGFEMKRWDITFVSYRSEVIKAKNETEAGVIAEEHRQPNERVGVIEETDEEADEEIE